MRVRGTLWVFETPVHGLARWAGGSGAACPRLLHSKCPERATSAHSCVCAAPSDAGSRGRNGRSGLRSCKISLPGLSQNTSATPGLHDDHGQTKPPGVKGSFEDVRATAPSPEKCLRIYMPTLSLQLPQVHGLDGLMAVLQEQQTNENPSSL